MIFLITLSLILSALPSRSGDGTIVISQLAMVIKGELLEVADSNALPQTQVGCKILYVIHFKTNIWVLTYTPLHDLLDDTLKVYSYMIPEVCDHC